MLRTIGVVEVLVVLLEPEQHGVERQKGDGHHCRRRRDHRHATAVVVAVAACRTCAARVDSVDTTTAAE